jgi:hypothetical protein
MIMPYKIPKRFTIEMVHKVTILINSLPKENGIHSVLSPREIVTGKKFWCPSIKIGQCIQGHTGGTNDTDQGRSIDALYIGRADNGSGHVVFKLNTKQPVSVNRVTIIPTSEANMKTVNDIGEQERQPEGIEFLDLNGRITLQDFTNGCGDDDDSNASDDDFKIDDKDEVLLEEEEGIIGNDDPDSEEDYFQNPIQQHNTEVRNNNEPISNIIPRSKRGAIPIVTLSNTTLPTERQECDKRKKKNVNDEAVSIDNELDDTDAPSTETTKVGVHTNDNTVESDDDTDNNDDSCI